jgi:hypothetical protein
MRPAAGCRRAAGAVLLATALFGCRAFPRGSGGTDGAAADASDDVHEAGPSAVAEAGPADDAIPQASSEELTARARHLLEAIAKDQSELATDIVFPRDGWLATREADDPGKEWERHVASPFRRAVHALSRRHKDLDRARFVSLELGHTVMQVTPHRHRWKKPLWTVTESRLTFMVDGRTRSLPIREMTAWRGAWYVTRLR